MGILLPDNGNKLHNLFTEFRAVENGRFQHATFTEA